MQKIFFYSFSFLFVFLFHYTLYAHSGKVNTEGCHNDKKNNEYHCHNTTNTTKEKAESGKYNRKEWNYGIDLDSDCQNTRNEILITHSEEKVNFYDKSKCRVKAGKWYDLYSGKYLYYSKEIEIDHIISLKEAHRSGGNLWDKKKKEKFANDPLNLIPVAKKLNRQKSHFDISDWVPPNPNYICSYLKKWKKLKKKYQLQMDMKEKQVIKKLDVKCSKQD